MELGALGEFVGAIAVVVTLVYLAVQLRQNSKVLRASMIQAAERGVSDVMGPWTQNVKTAALVNKARDSYNELSDDESAFVRMLVRRLLLHMDSMHWSFAQGMLPEEIWDREVFVLRLWLNSESGRAA